MTNCTANMELRKGKGKVTEFGVLDTLMTNITDGFTLRMKKIVDKFTVVPMGKRQQEKYESTIVRLCKTNNTKAGPYLDYFRSKIQVENDPSFSGEYKIGTKYNMNKRILLVGDASTREPCKEYLEGLGYDVVTAINGSVCSYKFKGNRGFSDTIDLMIIDHLMPGKNENGYNFGLEVKKEYDIPVIIMTGINDNVGFPGLDGVVHKPLNTKRIKDGKVVERPLDLRYIGNAIEDYFNNLNRSYSRPKSRGTKSLCSLLLH